MWMSKQQRPTHSTSARRRRLGTIGSLRLIALIAVAALAGACDAAIVNITQRPLPGTNSTFVYAAEPGEIYAEIVGNPFSSPDGEVQAAVLTAMAQAFPKLGPHFSPTRTEQTREAYRFVVVLNRPERFNHNKLCEPGLTDDGAPRTGALRIAVGFCENDLLISSANGRVTRPSGPSDPAFADLIRATASEVIPRPEQENRPERD